ncbi:hypothetical protein BN132_3506 [Cronobacter turicensis 564]|nr:hypothetical protein BN132_3506 [Cronobacter turicensis 564]
MQAFFFSASTFSLFYIAVANDASPFSPGVLHKKSPHRRAFLLL